MATVLDPPRPWPTSKRLLTEADFAALPDQLPSGPVKYELHRGEVVVMAPPGDCHAGQQSNAMKFFLKLQAAGAGRCKGEGMIVLCRRPLTLKAPISTS